jgi:tetratricopeptide (TPR) repeat protein
MAKQHMMARSMKKAIIHAFILVAALCVSGCSQFRQAPVVQTPGAILPDGASVKEQHLSARYYYLESLVMHLQNQLKPAVISLEKAIVADPDSSFLRRDLIRLYLELEQEEKAMALAEDLAKQDPKDVDNLLMLVRLKKDSRQESQLHQWLVQILKLDPENKETYLRLGRIYMENQQVKEALDLFSRMAARLPEYYVAHFYLGEAHLLSGNFKAAKESFLQTIRLEPDLVEPRFKIADILGNPKNQADEINHKNIMDIYKEILEIEPENERALLEMALLHHKIGQTDKAFDLFTELGKNARNNSRLVMTAVDLFISQKRYEDAVTVFSLMQKADPDNDNLNFFLGLAHESNTTPDQAVRYYLKVTPAHPQYKKTLLTIAFLYREMGQETNGVSFLEQHHKNNPKDIDIISYLSAFYEQQGRLETAMDLLAKGLADAPENTSLLFRLGTIQDKAGKKEACIATMKKIVDIDPEDASALNYLGYTYADLGIHLDQAEILIQKAMEIKPEDGYITDSMGWVYFQQKKYEKAVLYLEQAAELTDFESIIADHLADAYVKTGRLSKALAMYRKALANAKKEDADLVRQIQEKIKDLENRSGESDTEKTAPVTP